MTFSLTAARFSAPPRLRASLLSNDVRSYGGVISTLPLWLLPRNNPTPSAAGFL